MKRLIVKWLEKACVWTHPITHHQPWLWLPIRNGWCPLALADRRMEDRTLNPGDPMIVERTDRWQDALDRIHEGDPPKGPPKIVKPKPAPMSKGPNVAYTTPAYIDRALTRVIGDAEIIGALFPDYLEARDILTGSPLRAARTGARVQGGDMADPTLAHALAELDDPARQVNEDLLEAVQAWRTQGKWIRDQMNDTIAATRRRPRSDREQRDHERAMRDLECRCPEDCKRNWTIDPSSATPWAGYHQSCRDRDRKRLQRQDGTEACDVPCDVLEPVTVKTSAPVEPLLPSGAVVVERKAWCRFCDTDVLEADLTLHGNGRCA